MWIRLPKWADWSAPFLSAFAERPFSYINCHSDICFILRRYLNCTYCQCALSCFNWNFQNFLIIWFEEKWNPDGMSNFWRGQSEWWNILELVGTVMQIIFPFKCLQLPNSFTLFLALSPVETFFVCWWLFQTDQTFANRPGIPSEWHQQSFNYVGMGLPTKLGLSNGLDPDQDDILSVLSWSGSKLFTKVNSSWLKSQLARKDLKYLSDMKNYFSRKYLIVEVRVILNFIVRTGYMGVQMQGSHSLEKYLNLEGFLGKVLEN